MSAADDLCFATVAELADKLKARAVSPVALAQAYLDRIDRIAPKLSCFVTVTKDLALAEAHKAEEEIARGAYRGPLHGVPYGLKDLVDTKGIRTTWGAKPLSARVGERDATVVTRLREAGAVLLGKLSMIELAGGLGYHWADAALNGACKTPWDLGRWAGGSSSGSGSATSAGLVGFAIGSETWGSIVCPAAFCGVTGHRPTYGAVSRRGAMALSYTMDKLGPIARSAADCALVLSAIAGPDPADRSSVAAPPGLAAVVPRFPEKAAVFPLFPDRPPVDPKTRAAFEAALDVFRKNGTALETIKLPDFPYEAIASLMIDAEGKNAFDFLLRDGRDKELSDKGHHEPAPPAGPVATAADYVRAMRARRAIQDRLDELFEHYPMILSPNLPWVAPPIDQSFAETLPDDVPDPLGAAGNLAGLPAVAFPIGFAGPGKLPVSLQIVGRSFDDARILAAAAAYQGKTAWHRERPPTG
jgi:aspartyl-tRNA(Asn)/glutamyl-tRNA(Gln) amidotransferase subunit A